MPDWDITAPNGELLVITSDKPPTPEEARDIFIQTIGGSEEKPINDSPLSSGQRVALSFGTQDGNKEYLQQNYEDAMDDPNDPGKYLVQQDGLWHRVDEQGITFGDVEDTIGKGLVAFTSAVGEIGGGVLGTMAAPGVGTGVGLVGGAAAGGAGGEFIRQKIGQQLGTVTPDDINDIEVATEGALGAIGAGFGVAISRFGKQGLKQAVKKVKGTRIPKSVSSFWDSVIGVSDGATDTLLNNTDEVTNFTKWTGKNQAPKAMEIADDVVKFAKETKVELGEIKRVARSQANAVGKTVEPLAVIDTVIDDTTGETLYDTLSRMRVVAPKGDPLLVDSPMLKKMDRLLNKKALTFDDIDVAIGQIDAVTKYNNIPDQERVAEGALKKVRLALKKQRNANFGIEDSYDEMSDLIRSVQDADGKDLFKSVKGVDSLMRNIDGAANIRNKEILEQLGELNPSFKDILNKRKIWKASNEFNSFLPSSNGGFGSGAGRANLLRGQFVAGSAGAGGFAGGVPGAAVSGGLAALSLAPKTTARAVRAGRIGQAGARLTGKTIGATTRQGATRFGMDKLGL